jgi:hypothetical protein
LPPCLRHKDRDARWTVKFSKAKPREDGSMPPVDLAIPLFGYQNQVSIDRRFGFIRRLAATDAAAYEGRRLRQGLLDKSNTASGVWADTAYRSAANETFRTKYGFVSHIHRKKPKGRAMPDTMRRANNAKSKIRARVEHATICCNDCRSWSPVAVFSRHVAPTAYGLEYVQDATNDTTIIDARLTGLAAGQMWINRGPRFVG